jgi:hypothetical protein
LHGREIEQEETLQAFQDEENIDIGSIARLVAGNRDEEEKCTDANGAEPGSGRFSRRDDARRTPAARNSSRQPL